MPAAHPHQIFLGVPPHTPGIYTPKEMSTKIVKGKYEAKPSMRSAWIFTMLHSNKTLTKIAVNDLLAVQVAENEQKYKLSVCMPMSYFNVIHAMIYHERIRSFCCCAPSRREKSGERRKLQGEGVGWCKFFPCF